MTTRTRLDVEVIIVGAGPVGCLLAVLLQTYGVTTALVDRDPEPYRLPRAIVMDDENQRTFHMLGLGDDLASMTTPLAGADFVSADGERLFGVDVPPVGRLGLPPVVCHFQPELDAMLRACAAARGSRTLFGQTATDMVRHDGGVEVVLDDSSVVTGHMLVGCDGATSWTRRTAGLGLEDLGFDQDWVVVDVEVHPGRGEQLPLVLQQICDPLRPTTYVPGHARYRRWEFQVQPDDDINEMVSDAGMWQLLAPWLSPSDATIVRTAAYRFHAVVAPLMRSGRVFLAGDAAHQMPPFLGQGLNSGMRDATNLAWKLEWVLRNRAGERLLDSYSAEREPHVRSVVAHAADTGRLIDQLAGRDSHDLDNSSGYGGSRPTPRLAGALFLRSGEGGDDGSDGRVGLPCPWMPEVWTELSGPTPVWVLAASRHPGASGLGLNDARVREVQVDSWRLAEQDWLMVRPDGIVSAAGTGDAAFRTAWQHLSRVM